VRSAHTAAQVEIPAEWAQAMAAQRRRSRLVDAAYLSSRRRPVLEELAYLRLLSGWGARRRYLAGYFVIDDHVGGSGQRVSLRERARYLWSRVSQRSG
jgi:hypothetical protein